MPMPRGDFVGLVEDDSDVVVVAVVGPDAAVVLTVSAENGDQFIRRRPCLRVTRARI